MIIASPDRIRIPLVNRTIGQGKDIAVQDPPPDAEQNPRGASEEEGIAEGESEISKGRIIRRGRLSQESLPPAIGSNFRLDSPLNQKSGFTLNINPAESEVPETDREMTMDELDLLSYLRSDPAHIQPLRGNPSRKIRAGASSHSQPATGGGIEYDITPWAESAVARIQRNWSIPPLQGQEDKKTVEISVVVAKSGELISFGIRNSSGMSYLDAAALNAVKLSAPLPALPNDFPLDRLEADLMFQYYE